MVDGALCGAVEGREGRDVGVPGIGLVDFERAGVDFVHAEAAVKICQWGYGGADPAGGLGVGGCALRAVLGVVDHDLVFVGVAEEDIGNDVGRVAIHDLVEEVGGVIQGVRTIPAGQDVSDDPNSLLGILCGLEFLDEEVKHAGDIGVCGVDVVEEITSVPEIGVQRNDTETVLILDRVSPVSGPCLIRCSRINPAIVLPKLCDMVIVPALLLSKRSGQTVRRVDSLIEMLETGCPALVDSRITRGIRGIAEKKGAF